MDDLTGIPHLNSEGHVHMVDVGAKAITAREAVAEGRIMTRPDVVRLVSSGQAPKGDVLAVARVAAVVAAKRTSEWIPLAHPINLAGVEVEVRAEENAFHVVASVKTVGQTGVEMEALTAVSAALLTLYDMLKAQDRSMTITGIRLLSKSGGRSGQFVRKGGHTDAHRDTDE